MKTRRGNLAAITTILMASAITGEDVFGLSKIADRTYDVVPNPDTRQLREFFIKGKKVMAYSRKDAIKRIKHQGRKGGEK